MSRIIAFAWLLLTLVSLALGANAQGNLRQRPLKPRQVRQLRLRPDGTPEFLNVNRLPYFYNKKALKAIQQAEKRHNYAQARTLLEQYVAQFGIENFYRDTNMLWRLGQLCERANQEEKAKAYYRLALKHHRQDVRKVQLYYDSLEQKDTDLYVPLKEYYALVEYRKNIATFRPPKGVYTSMGSAVNSDAPDYGPAITADADLLIFSSKRKVRGLYSIVDEDLYLSRREGESWTDAEPLPKPINSQYNEGSACLSKDGKTLYFARCECLECNGNCDLYVAKLGANGEWSVPKSLGAQVNSKAWDSQPTLSPGEDTLYFASDRLGGFGMSDIWFTHKLKNGEWSAAQNMGPIVNTRESEVSPFYHPLYHVLYFSSRGQLLNFGDFDIYKTYRVRGRWQEPKNIGPLVNGKGSEYYFTIDGDSKNLYYARSEEKTLKNLDLYSFPLPMEAQPLATTHVEGTLLDSVSSKPLNGIVSVIDTDNGIEVASKYLRDDGSFDFDLIEGSHYVLLIQSPDFFSVEKQLELKGDTVMKLMTNSIDYGLPLIFKNIEFDQDKASIRASMHPVLDRIALFMVDHPDFRLSIEGHTDSRGNPEFNEKLSQDRAEAIRRYIEQKGKLKPNRIDSMGYGSTKPLKDEVTEEDARTNRRVEFRIIKPEGAGGAKDAGAGSGW
ncbi:OmpA family protein [Hymenobacter lutimineralis]|uniref:OmpA family protein n=1 Tax=Hymenobacter lutimineralis TaxID=2606448 RepID=A0A5D6UZQ6_9BACT|nr:MULTISPECIES: OmpA family protein [Hymenobacter]QIX60731.1 OmpA family protein [Hymenobacter sp. BT18]TYZ08630.1 OmpA family protein [Hymenobacter lutimineralis]